MEWKQILNVADDEYLIGISNKGIVKRAYKDKEEQLPSITETDEELTVLALGETVQIRYPLGDSKCSCPSRTICRHIILAVLCAKEQYDAEDVQVSEQSCSEDAVEDSLTKVWKEIEEYPKEKLFSILGKKGIKGLSEHIHRERNAELTETSVITVKLPVQDKTVKLLSPLEYSTCTCHKKEMCVHKAEAIFWCKWSKKQLAPDDLSSPERLSDATGQQVSETAGQMRECLEELFMTGLCRSSSETVSMLERLAISAHNSSLPNLENRLRAIAGMYENYLKRSAMFSMSETRRRIEMLYKDADILSKEENHSQVEEIAGEFRTQYYPVGELELVGIAQEHFDKQSGYDGDIYYFLEKHTKKWYTYTTMQPTFYDKYNRRKKVRPMTPWGIDVPLERLMTLEIRLENAKADSMQRLSSTQETNGFAVDTRKLTEELLCGFYFEDFGDAFKTYMEKNYDGLSKKKTPKELVFLQPVKTQKAVFDQTEQVLRMALYDRCGKKVLIEIPYTQKDEKKIRYLERFHETLPPCFVGRIYLKDALIRCYPVAMFKMNPIVSEEEEMESTDAEENSIYDKILQFLDEVDMLLGDLYQVGFLSVQESVLLRMEELGKLAAMYGMKNLNEHLTEFARDVEKQRHQIGQSERDTNQMIRSYFVLCDYVSYAQKQTMFDKANNYYCGTWGGN